MSKKVILITFGLILLLTGNLHGGLFSTPADIEETKPFQVGGEIEPADDGYKDYLAFFVIGAIGFASLIGIWLIIRMKTMALRKRFKIITWVISLAAFVGLVALGITEGHSDPFVCFIYGLTIFSGIWLIYWILFWSVRGFHKIGKVKILQIIKWAAIIFFASILFHLADYVVHKTIKVFEETETAIFVKEP